MEVSVSNAQEKRVTVKKARETLGAKAERLTDKQVEIILRSLYALCEKVVQNTTNTI